MKIKENKYDDDEEEHDDNSNHTQTISSGIMSIEDSPNALV